MSRSTEYGLGSSTKFGELLVPSFWEGDFGKHGNLDWGKRRARMDRSRRGGMFKRNAVEILIHEKLNTAWDVGKP